MREPYENTGKYMMRYTAIAVKNITNTRGVTHVFESSTAEWLDGGHFYATAGGK
jgi:hypothetical protein